MNLYEINREILACIDYETGEILDSQRLEMLEMEKEKKIENIGLWIKNLEAEAEALKMERNDFITLTKEEYSELLHARVAFDFNWYNFIKRVVFATLQGC